MWRPTHPTARGPRHLMRRSASRSPTHQLANPVLALKTRHPYAPHPTSLVPSTRHPSCRHHTLQPQHANLPSPCPTQIPHAHIYFPHIMDRPSLATAPSHCTHHPRIPTLELTLSSLLCSPSNSTFADHARDCLAAALPAQTRSTLLCRLL